MWKNVRHNHFMLVTGLETLLLGAYLIYVANVFKEPISDHFHHIIQHAQDPYVSILLIIVGTLAVIVAVLDVHQFRARRVALVAMVMVWSVYFILFMWHDFHTPGPMKFGTILIGFVLVRLFAELAWGDKT
ncbi:MULTISPECIES: hypothetical protein [unclassified Levilactobacillus]|uniref:hypothetical protein n=1 Tax=unclassified Levilactobacillus TaxID=2767918 RepID=UPI002FF1E479